MTDEKPANQESPGQSPQQGDESAVNQFKPLATEPTTKAAKPDTEKRFLPLQTEGIPLSDSEQKNIQRLIDREDK